MRQHLIRLMDRLKGSAFALPVATAVAIAMLAVSETSYRESRRQLAELSEMGKLRLEVSRIARKVSDAESSQRGYVLTGREEYLKPLHDAETELRQSAKTLERLESASDDAEMTSLRQALATVIAAKLSEMNTIVETYATGRKEAARDLVLTGIGREQMDSIRSLSDRMLTRQSERITRGLDAVYATFLWSRVGIATVTLMSLAVLALFLRQSRELARQRKQQQAALQAERDRLEGDVRHRTAELTELARHLQTAREDERSRLARDLHDELGALLTTAKLDVARIRPRVQQLMPDQVDRLTHLTEALDNGIVLKRRIIEDLRPSTLDNLGLGPALEILCGEFGERLGVSIDLVLEPVPLSHSADLTVFRMVQEALTNIVKYAQATAVEVIVERIGELAQVQVRDNGQGFQSPHLAHTGRHGLIGMRYRVQSEGGELHIESFPGRGTQLTAQLPLATSPPD